jgi:gentisate 1,2-dioxygenase
MDRLEFEAELRSDGYRIVNSSVQPNLVAPNHCHDFYAKALVLGGEITITRDNNPVTFRAGQCFEVPSGCMHAEHVGPEGVLPCYQADAATAAPSPVRHSKATCAEKASRSFMEG